MTGQVPPERGATPSPCEPLTGEIVGLEGDRVRVRLATGVVGFFVEGLEDAQSSYQIGQQGLFRIQQCDEDGEILVQPTALEERQAPRAFQDDVDRLQDALNRRQQAPLSHDHHPSLPPSMVNEQPMQQWLQRTEKTLERLRKNRSKRLDDEVYSGS